MASLLPVLRVVPFLLFLVGILRLVFDVRALHLSGVSQALSLEMEAELRWLSIAAYLGAIDDALWTIGFAAVVWASVRYLEKAGAA